MGLSDGERHEKIAHIVHALYEIKRFDYHDSLNPILDGLWYDFLGRTSNGLHWLLGSDSNANHLGEFSLLRIEFSASMPRKEKETEHTPWRWAMEYKPDIECLLEPDNEEARIWRIVRLIESYFYAVNRYDDKFSSNMEKLTRSICTLRGKCFAIIMNDWRFAAAWMMSAVLDRCFPYSDDDLLTSCGDHFNWHHYLRVDGQDAREVYRIFKKYQFSEFTTHDKLCTVLRWMGRRFHYEHQHKDLLNKVALWNAKSQLVADFRSQGLTNDEIRHEIDESPDNFKSLNWVGVGEIAEICVKNKAAHEAHEKESSNTYTPYCYFTHQSKEWRGYDPSDEETE